MFAFRQRNAIVFQILDVGSNIPPVGNDILLVGGDIGCVFARSFQVSVRYRVLELLLVVFQVCLIRLEVFLVRLQVLQVLTDVGPIQTCVPGKNRIRRKAEQCRCNCPFPIHVRTSPNEPNRWLIIKDGAALLYPIRHNLWINGVVHIDE